jgi:hypothetical protein
VKVEDVPTNKELATKPSTPKRVKKAPLRSAMVEDELTSDCYVVVGAFGVQSNVDRMIERLSKMGYSSARMTRNNLTQIGVPAACESAEVAQILADLQQNVEAAAWIYNR